jgi:uncharacterized membrane protein
MTQAEIPSRRRAPLHPGLIASGATLLIAVFLTDLAYWQSALFQWNNFSGWLLTGGLVLAALAAVAFVIDVASQRIGRVSWLRFAALAIAVILAIVDALVHSRDAYTAVVPEGLALSAAVALILLVVGLSGGWSLASRAPASVLAVRTVRP